LVLGKNSLKISKKRFIRRWYI